MFKTGDNVLGYILLGIGAPLILGTTYGLVRLFYGKRKPSKKQSSRAMLKFDGNYGDKKLIE